MFKGKKIIITQNALHFLSGSEIVTLELAEYFQNAGAEVLVFTWYFAGSIRHEFEKRHIPVTTNEDDSRLDGADYVWVHHQVLPLRILNRLALSAPHPVFLFFHMSALEHIALEHPFIYDLERRLSSCSLFVSEKTLEKAKDGYIDSKKYHHLAVFKNFIPENFLNYSKSRPAPTSIKKILIVSNHPPEEIKSARKLLKQQNIIVDHLGEGGRKELISPEIIGKYDLVISIGKTVQYCLGMGVPVYVYDHFGGYGYLNAKNIKEATSHNFSGNGAPRKTPEAIASEIIKNYNSARNYQTKNLETFREDFSLKNNLEKIFSSLTPKAIKPFSGPYLRYVKNVESLVRDKIIAENNLVITSREKDEYAAAYNKSSDTIQGLRIALAEQEKRYKNLCKSSLVRIVRKLRRLKGEKDL